MNQKKIIRQPHLSDPVDALLADVAIRIQLNRTDYEKARGRYQTISQWIDREDSPLRDLVEIFYPQGSMAIGATIASRLRTDEFDVDGAAQVNLPKQATPQQALDLLYEAIRGAPGSRYYRQTRRRTRCVTIDYSDNMHIDVTPMLRRRNMPERESWIFHHRPESRREAGERLIANPYGFANWFRSATPLDLDFADSYQNRVRMYEETVLAKADTEPVPPQEPPIRKSVAVIVLQLLKRWRNVQYDARLGRRPPSILIAKLVADNPHKEGSLSETLLYQARCMLVALEQRHSAGLLLHVTNPMCPDDVLTDRWPASLQDQRIFLDDLRSMVTRIERLLSGRDLDEMQRIMVDLFGEQPTRDAFSAFNERLGGVIRDRQSKHIQAAGRIVLPTGAIGGSLGVKHRARSTPGHTFYGGRASE